MKRNANTLFIMLGLCLGVGVGEWLYDPSWAPGAPESQHQSATLLHLFHFMGFTVFMGLLKMLIIPLIAASVVVAVTSVGDFRKLGRLGSWTLLYYLTTMFIAVGIGLLCVNIIEPGTHVSQEQLSQTQGFVGGGGEQKAALERGSSSSLLSVFENLVKMMIPPNIIAAMADGQTLGIIIFSMFFGAVVTLCGSRGQPVVALAESTFSVLMKMVEIVLLLAPLGVFSLIAWTISRIGLGVFGESIGLYMFTVVLGLLIHGLVVLPLILFLLTRKNPFLYLYQMRRALMTAFGTDSSGATLPVTMECAVEEGGVEKETAGLVLPLGATLNMDGTALYEAVAVVFMAQAFGVQLETSQMVIIAFTATLAAMGAAAIPSAGLVTMVIVLEATNQSLQGMGEAGAVIPLAAIGLIIGVDRILDMVRTTVNVWGDAVGAKLLSR